jgi:hypothetical protein
MTDGPDPVNPLPGKTVEHLYRENVAMRKRIARQRRALKEYQKMWNIHMCAYAKGWQAAVSSMTEQQ